MTQSDRAGGRVRDLRGSVLTRLRNHTALTDRLEAADGVDAGGEMIVPAFTAQRWHDDDTAPDPPDVAVAVTVVTGSSARENRQERVNLTVQTSLQIRRRALAANGVAWVDEIRDELAAILTSHVDGWTAQGETGGTPEPLWDDSINRYVSAQRFDMQRFG